MDQRPTILIVEDTDSWRRVLVTLLSKEFSITMRESYQAGLEALGLQWPPFHLVVTDMRLKDNEPTNKDGIELVKKIHAENKDGKIYTQVIVVTGYGSAKTARQALVKYGAIDFIEKAPEGGSFYRDFLESVREACSRAEKKREAWLRKYRLERWKEHLFQNFARYPRNTPGADDKSCVILMPDDSDLEDVYDRVADAIQEGTECKPYRVQNNPSQYVFRDQLWPVLNQAQVIVADIASNDPFIFYCLGLAHALCKRVILLTKNSETLPCSPGSVECIEYAEDMPSLWDLCERLPLAINSALKMEREAQYDPFRKRDYGPEDLSKHCVAVWSTSEAAEANRIYLENVIQRRIIERGEKLSIHVVNNVLRSPHGVETVWKEIHRSQFVLADLSTHDPGIYYTIGLSHALFRPTIVITSDPDLIAVDLPVQWQFEYVPDFNDLRGGFHFEKELRDAIRQIRETNDDFFSKMEEAAQPYGPVSPSVEQISTIEGPSSYSPQPSQEPQPSTESLRSRIDPDNPPIGVIRRLLTASFTSDELRRFCMDNPRMRDVVNRFGSHSLDDMVEAVIIYCRGDLLWDELLAEVKEIKPRQFARFKQELYGATLKD